MGCYHILNGDALLYAFPDQLPGERIVVRECLVDGDVQAETMEQLYANRAKFVSTYSEDSAEGEYYEKVVPEFRKMESISEDSEINLWFEDDLFCQVNLWFVIYLLFETNKERSLYLVRPTSSIQFGFGGMSQDELIKAFEFRIEITKSDLKELKTLWPNYKKRNTTQLLKIAEDFNQHYPFLLPAVQAHIDRLPTSNGMGKPERVLMEIVEELKTKNFGIVFTEFCKREPIYGFGDLQVKRIWKEVIERS